MLEKGLFLLVVFGCNFIQVIAAFGGTMLAMPFSILLIGTTKARVVLNVSTLPSCALPLVKDFKSVRWGQVLKIIALMIIGVIIGQIIIAKIKLESFLPFYSLLVIGVALKNFFVKKEIIIPSWLGVIILLAAGIIHGIFLSGGALLVIYAMDKFKDKTEFRASMSVIWIVLDSVLVFIHIAQGLMMAENLILIAVSLLAASLGMLAGDRVQKHIDGDKFRVLANFLLLFSGLMLLYNCIFT